MKTKKANSLITLSEKTSPVAKYKIHKNTRCTRTNKQLKLRCLYRRKRSAKDKVETRVRTELDVETRF